MLRMGARLGWGLALTSCLCSSMVGQQTSASLFPSLSGQNTQQKPPNEERGKMPENVSGSLQSSGPPSLAKARGGLNVVGGGGSCRVPTCFELWGYAQQPAASASTAVAATPRISRLSPSRTGSWDAGR